MPAGFSYAPPSEAKSVVGEDLEKLKQRWPLLDYLQQQNWAAQPAGYDSEFVGLCPLHRETRPSSMSMPAKIFSTATVAARVAM
jgi:hypothetical protein